MKGPHRLICYAVVFGLFLLVNIPLAASISAAPRPVRVMTRNLYLGADLAPIYSADTLEELATKAAQQFQMVQATDFPSRARMLAAEIKDADPDVIGLQEASLWKKGDLGVLDGPITPATTVVYDYLSLLQAALTSQGDPYTVAVTQFTADGEVPTALGYDVRLTQRNAILVKAGLAPDELSIANPTGGLYNTYLSFTAAGFPVQDRRGWLSVDVTANKRTFRFVDTHLDSTVPAIATAQANELLNGPLIATVPVVLAGDLNSGPEDPVPGAYARFISASFTDTWVQSNGSTPGPTCCNVENLLNPVPTLTTRSDQILTRPRVGVGLVKRTGIDPDNRTSSGLWPSDHAGVLAVLTP
jgi:endonuclease/exonuclease/phosphatase family metal-dependent hydrolase